MIDRLLKFLDLPIGWCHGRGKSFDIQTVKSAQKIVDKLDNSGSEKTEVFPGEESDILVSGYKNLYSADMTCYENGKFTFSVYDNNYDFVCSTDCDMLECVLELIENLDW